MLEHYPDDIYQIFEYECHFDIRLNLRAGGNPLKSIQMTLILNGPTCASNLNVSLTLRRVYASSLL